MVKHPVFFWADFLSFCILKCFDLKWFDLSWKKFLPLPKNLMIDTKIVKNDSKIVFSLFLFFANFNLCLWLIPSQCVFDCKVFCSFLYYRNLFVQWYKQFRRSFDLPFIFRLIKSGMKFCKYIVNKLERKKEVSFSLSLVNNVLKIKNSIQIILSHIKLIFWMCEQ